MRKKHGSVRTIYTMDPSDQLATVMRRLLPSNFDCASQPFFDCGRLWQHTRYKCRITCENPKVSFKGAQQEVKHGTNATGCTGWQQYWHCVFHSGCNVALYTRQYPQWPIGILKPSATLRWHFLSNSTSVVLSTLDWTSEKISQRWGFLIETSMVDKQDDLGFQMCPCAEKTIREWLKKIGRKAKEWMS